MQNGEPDSVSTTGYDQVALLVRLRLDGERGDALSERMELCWSACYARCAGVESDFTEPFAGVTVRGASLSPCFDDPTLERIWCRTTADRGRDFAEWDGLPYEDIVVSHCPPEGILDTAGEHGEKRIGSPGLLRYILRRVPRLVVCGHVHRDGGKSVWVHSVAKQADAPRYPLFDDSDRMGCYYFGSTLVVNCATVPMLVTMGWCSMTAVPVGTGFNTQKGKQAK